VWTDALRVLAPQARRFGPMQFPSKEAAMRLVYRSLLCASTGPVLVLIVALAARAEGQLGMSEIRLTNAEEPIDSEPTEPSTLVLTSDEQALPAPPATEPVAEIAVEAKPTKSATITPPFRRPRTSFKTQAEPPAANNQIRPALNFYGGNPARATLSQFPTRSPIQAGPQQPMQQQIKPFNTIYREPTISPYMNLYREENDSEAAPNYFAFVRPQLDQIEENRTQQMEIQKLSRQTQGRARTTAPQQYQATGKSNRSSPARYMDTAQFYSGWSR
jgi:hypothetical protein